MENKDIVQLIADSFGISAVRMGSKDRSEDVTIAKTAYCGLVRDIQKSTTINVLLGISAPSVRKFIVACDELRKKDSKFAKKYNELERKLRNSI